jgi:hypothetical protein
MKTMISHDLVYTNHMSDIASDQKEFIFLIILSSIMAYFFVFKGFATGDSILYAHGIEAIWKNGLREIPDNFNGEIAFGYYIMLYLLCSVLQAHFALSAIMNYVNALSSILMIGIFYFLIISLGFNKKVALFSCITVLIAPAIWLLSHYGHPGMPCLAFFVGSLLVLANLDFHNLAKLSQRTRLIAFTILSYLALIMRLDIFLSFGAYFGILYYKKTLTAYNIYRLLGVLFGILSLVFITRYYFLSYFINPEGGTLAHHLGDKLYGAYIPREIAKNLLYWVLGMSPFIAVLVLLGLVRFGITSSPAGLFFSWVSPYIVFLPFHNMDFARLSAPTILIAALIAIAFLDQKFPAAAKTVAMALTLVVAQLVALGINYPLQARFPFRLKFHDRGLTSVPLGFLPTDHYYRQQVTLAREEVAEQVARERNANILIIDLASSTCYYDYFIRKYRDVVELTDDKIVTKENTFYFLIPDNNLSADHPISGFLHNTDISIGKIHVTPFAEEYQVDPKKLFLDKSDLTPLLAYEVSMMDMRRKILSK